jgi:AcrR family transcriptional regulator
VTPETAPVSHADSRAQRRKAILEATRELCRNQGYEAMTMDAVALHAGITKPTLYTYFPKKEELAVEAFVESVESRVAFMDSLPAGLTPLSRFKQLLHYVLHEKITADRIVLAWPGPPVSTHPRFQAAFRSLVDAGVAMLKEGQAIGEANPNLDPYIVIQTYICIVTDPRLERLAREGNASPEKMVETLYAILVAGLQPQASD